MMKVCFKCDKKQDISQFYKHKAMGDGHLGKCKACTKKDVSQHRAENLEAIQSYDRIRGSLPNRVKAREEYRKTISCQLSMNNSSKKWAKNNPKKRTAHSMVQTAIKNKVIEKLPCEICGNKNSHGHHEDYDKPLDVIWLCHIHHMARHKELSEEKRRA